MIEAGRQAGIHSEIAATAAAGIAWRIMPTGPIHLTLGVVVIHDFDVPLDKVVIVIGRIGGGVAGITEQHLKRDADGGVSGKTAKQ